MMKQTVNINGHTCTLLYKVTCVYRDNKRGCVIKHWHSPDLAMIYADAMLDKGLYASATIETFQNNICIQRMTREI